MSLYQNLLESLKKWYGKQTRAQLVEHTVLSALLLYTLKKLLQKGIVSSGFSVVENIPGAKSFIQQKISEEAKSTIREMFPKSSSSYERYRSIPAKGQPKQELLALMDQMKIDNHDLKPSEGKAFAYVYDGGDEHNKFTKEAYTKFLHTNVLNPLAFASLRNMENEVVRMACTMLHGDEKTCGSLSTGGTESLLLMVKTYRDRAHALHPEIRNPEMILPTTAHPGMLKGSHYFGVKVVFAPIGDDFAVDLESVKKLITKNTILLVGSAPQYPHGIMDNIEGLGKIAEDHNLPLHVDSCIGGFVLPFIEKLGYKVPKWDFRVPGVTSISADIHKYGYSPKGTSVIAYRNAEIRKFQFSVFAEWCGGFYISPTLMGSRGGGPIASAWASLVGLGEEGFLERTELIMKTKEFLISGVNNIEGLYILGNPESSIIAFSTNNDLNIFSIADQMEKLGGWKLERTREPDAVHLTLMPNHFHNKEKFISDLTETVALVKKDPSKYLKEGSAAMYGGINVIPKGFNLVEDFLTCFLDETFSF